jgi:hypothetical protein
MVAGARGIPLDNFILILNESVRSTSNKVGFNLSSIKQIRFKQQKVLREKLKVNILKFYKFKQ